MQCFTQTKSATLHFHLHDNDKLYKLTKKVPLSTKITTLKHHKIKTLKHHKIKTPLKRLKHLADDRSVWWAEVSKKKSGSSYSVSLEIYHLKAN